MDSRSCETESEPGRGLTKTSDDEDRKRAAEEAKQDGGDDRFPGSTAMASLPLTATRAWRKRRASRAGSHSYASSGDDSGDEDEDEEDPPSNYLSPSRASVTALAVAHAVEKCRCSAGRASHRTADVVPTESESEKELQCQCRSERLKANRLSARKCRQKRKLKIEKMRLTVRRLTEENDRMRGENKELIRMRDNWLGKAQQMLPPMPPQLPNMMESQQQEEQKPGGRQGQQHQQQEEAKEELAFSRDGNNCSGNNQASFALTTRATGSMPLTLLDATVGRAMGTVFVNGRGRSLQDPLQVPCSSDSNQAMRQAQQQPVGAPQLRVHAAQQRPQPQQGLSPQQHQSFHAAPTMNIAAQHHPHLQQVIAHHHSTSGPSLQQHAAVVQHPPPQPPPPQVILNHAPSHPATATVPAATIISHHPHQPGLVLPLVQVPLGLPQGVPPQMPAPAAPAPVFMIGDTTFIPAGTLLNQQSIVALPNGSIPAARQPVLNLPQALLQGLQRGSGPMVIRGAPVPSIGAAVSDGAQLMPTAISPSAAGREWESATFASILRASISRDGAAGGTGSDAQTARRIVTRRRAPTYEPDIAGGSEVPDVQRSSAG